jgi:hypothetical protein
MVNTKLVSLLKSLDAAEFRKLHLFLQSPYYNRNQSVIDLYTCLRKYYPKFDSPRLEKEAVFRQLFPDRPFNMNSLRKLMSALTQLVEEYLLTLEYGQERFLKKRLLAGIYGRRNLFDLFQKSNLELIAELHAAPCRSQDYYAQLFHLNREMFFYPATDRKTSGKELLEQAMENLDSYYTLTKLQLSAEMRTRENILAEKHSIRFLEEIVRESRQSFASKNLLNLVYLNILDLHQGSDDPALFPSAIALFRKIIPGIDRLEQQTILHHLLNHCVRLINLGQTQRRQELFELYKLGIEFDLLIENNQITEITFSNIVATGASMQAFEWTKDFISNYAVFLNEEVREDINALSIALLHFNKMEYDETIEALLRCSFSDILNLLKSRCLLLRTYYEKFLIDDSFYFFLIDQANAFEKSIRRNKKIAKGKTRGYLNFIRFTKKIAQCRFRHKNTGELQQQLHAEETVSYKGWLLEKMR